MRGGDPEGHKKAGHDKVFSPSKVVKENVKAAYEHKTELNDLKKKYTNEDGAVITAPRNMLTNPLKVGPSVGKG
jgi:hypothetical protein